MAVFAASRGLLGVLATPIKRTVSSIPSSNFQTLAVTYPKEFVAHVELNRPDQRNAFNRQMWIEIRQCFQDLGVNPDCRVIILSGAGDKAFTSGLDFKSAMELGRDLAEHDDVARKANLLLRRIKEFQESLTSLEICPKPVIAAIHGYCIGAGVDIAAAADIRYCSKNALFQVKEVDIGMAADVGTLQRLPKIIGSASLVNELAYTGRVMDADEALRCGLVSAVLSDKASLLDKCVELAVKIAEKSPVAVQTTKRSLLYSRDHSVADGLEHIAVQNMAMLQSEDFYNAVGAQASKDTKPPIFAKL